MAGTTGVRTVAGRHEPAGRSAPFRSLMSAFPTGVSVVTALAADTRPHGLTCTSLTSVTMSPPTLLVCLNISSGTLGAVREAGRFAVNLLHARGRRAAEVFSSAQPDRFAAVEWRPGPALGEPWLTEDAFALAECRVVEINVVGDHAIVLGEVAGVSQSEEQVLLYGMRQFATWQA